MKISELKIGQKILHEGFEYEYKGIQKVKIAVGSVQKIVFQAIESTHRLLLPLTDGTTTLESKNIKLIL